MFLTFYGATEGDAPSISATLIMFLTLTDLRIDDSGLGYGILNYIASSFPAKCFLPTPQKILLSPYLGNMRRY